MINKRAKNVPSHGANKSGDTSISYNGMACFEVQIIGSKNPKLHITIVIRGNSINEDGLLPLNKLINISFGA